MIHRIDWISTYPIHSLVCGMKHYKGYPKERGDITIGNDVWIGYGAIILSGVKIGNGSVIGAYSLATKDVSSYSIVGGNPAKLIKKRFSEIKLTMLKKIAWWDWPICKIKTNMNLLQSNNLDEFFKKINECQ